MGLIFHHTFNLTSEAHVFYPKSNLTIDHATPYKLGTFFFIKVQFNPEDDSQLVVDRIDFEGKYKFDMIGKESFCPSKRPLTLTKGNWYSFYRTC